MAAATNWTIPSVTQALTAKKISARELRANFTIASNAAIRS